MSEPTILAREDQPYLGLAATVAMDRIASVADKLPGELFGWMQARGFEMRGAPFFRYLSFARDGTVDLEWAAPVATPVEGEGRVKAGVLPGGRYACLEHVGPFSGLREATGRLLDWAEANGHRLDQTREGERTRFGGRIELYLTDPRQEPDSARWRTDILIRLAD